MPSEQDTRFLAAALERGLLTPAQAKAVASRAEQGEGEVSRLLVRDGLFTDHIATAVAAQVDGAGVPETVGGFKVLAKLGQGGMGTVYRALQVSMHREVALKVIAPRFALDQAWSERFLREARIAGQVNHPNVITCYDVGEDKGYLYMALELMSGGDLGAYAREQAAKRIGALGEPWALHVVTDCAHGLCALHAAGLVHRDIKPANIFVTRDGIAKLGDLGLARLSGGDVHMTATGAPAMGTPAFMSPEQAAGAPVDIRTDLYALGASLYTLLVGEPPFTGTNIWAVMAQVMRDAAPDPRERNPTVSDAAAAIVLRCLAKDASRRYQTPGQLLEDLDAAIAGKPLRHAPLVMRARAGVPTANSDPRASTQYGFAPTGPVPRALRPLPWAVAVGVFAAIAIGVPLVLARLAPPPRVVAANPAPPLPPLRPSAQLDFDLAALAETPSARPLPTVGGDPAGPATPRTAPATGNPFAPVATAPAPALPVAKPVAKPSAPLPGAVPAITAAPPPATPAPAPAPVIAASPPPVVAPQRTVDASPLPPPGAVPPAVASPPVIAPIAVPATPPTAPIMSAPTPVVARDIPATAPPVIPPLAIRVDPPLPVDAARADPPQPPAIAVVAPPAPAAPAPPSTEPAPTPLTADLAPAPPLAPVVAEPAPPELPRAAVGQATATFWRERLFARGFPCVVESLPSGRIKVAPLERSLRSLDALNGVPIEELDLEHCERLDGDLAALSGMPLRVLKLRGCRRLRSLAGVSGAKLEELSLADCPALQGDLIALRGGQLTSLDCSGCRNLTGVHGVQGMPLTTLVLARCSSLRDLLPLRGLPLKTLDVSGCSSLSSLDGVQNAPLTTLTLGGCPIEDLGPLSGMALRSLDLDGCSHLKHLRGLAGMPLTRLSLSGCTGLGGDLTELRGMRLTSLSLRDCRSLTAFDGLQGMPLTGLDAAGCISVAGDLSALRGLPLTWLDISFCSKLTSLNGLQGMPLKRIKTTRCGALRERTALAAIPGVVEER